MSISCALMPSASSTGRSKSALKPSRVNTSRWRRYAMRDWARVLATSSTHHSSYRSQPPLATCSLSGTMSGCARKTCAACRPLA
eukprot:5477411-Prymnesium_polylepis.1